MMFTFDVDAAIGNEGIPPANSANSANPTTKKPTISNISEISNPAPSFSTEQRAGAHPPNDTLPDTAAEARRQRVLAMLADRPGIRYAILTDTRADPEAVLLTLAIRGQATCELRIPQAKYDGVLLLDLIERHGATVH